MRGYGWKCISVFHFLPQTLQMTTRCYGYWTTSGWESQSSSSKSDTISTHESMLSSSPLHTKSKDSLLEATHLCMSVWRRSFLMCCKYYLQLLLLLIILSDVFWLIHFIFQIIYKISRKIMKSVIIVSTKTLSYSVSCLVLSDHLSATSNSYGKLQHLNICHFYLTNNLKVQCLGLIGI